MPFMVNQQLCIGCGKCEKTCPLGAIKVINEKAVINYAICTCCGECAYICPKQAVYFISGRYLRGRKCKNRGQWRRLVT